VDATFQAVGEGAQPASASQDLRLENDFAVRATQLARSSCHLLWCVARHPWWHTHAGVTQKLSALVLVHVQPAAVQELGQLRASSGPSHNPGAAAKQQHVGGDMTTGGTHARV